MITGNPLARAIGRAVDAYAEDTGTPTEVVDLLTALEAIRYEVTEALINAYPNWFGTDHA